VRIGLVIYGDLEQASGGYLYDRHLVSLLKKRGHKVQVISMPWHRPIRAIWDNFSKSAFQKLRNLKVDVLLQDELNHPSLFLLNEKLKNEVTYPIISIVHMLRSRAHSEHSFQWLTQRIEAKYLNSVDGFIFNSRETGRIVKYMLTNSKPSVVATPGGNRFKPRVTDKEIGDRAKQFGPLRVLFLGNLTRNKAPHLLIQAAAELKRESIFLTFAGRSDVEPDYTEYLLRLAVSFGMEDRLYFAGHLEGKMLEASIRKSQVLAIPSAYEGFGIAYLEGMGFGLPAIASRGVGAKEIIQDGKNGFLIQVGDCERLATILKRLNRDRKLLAHMGLAARRSFLEFPTWDQSMRRVERFLASYNESIRQPNYGGRNE
jgi:glycosyltransferase involved in cell wall biosynthesis